MLEWKTSTRVFCFRHQETNCMSCLLVSMPCVWGRSVCVRLNLWCTKNSEILKEFLHVYTTMVVQCLCHYSARDAFSNAFFSAIIEAPFCLLLKHAQLKHYSFDLRYVFSWSLIVGEFVSSCQHHCAVRDRIFCACVYLFIAQRILTFQFSWYFNW